MNALATRIRKARLLAGLTQAELARQVGVKRSAVTQWEHPAGTVPSVPHLIEIALRTGSLFEWLATGRGAQRGNAEEAPPLLLEDCAQDLDESEALRRFRGVPAGKRRIALEILRVLGS